MVSPTSTRKTMFLKDRTRRLRPRSKNEICLAAELEAERIQTRAAELARSQSLPLLKLIKPGRAFPNTPHFLKRFPAFTPNKSLGDLAFLGPGRKSDTDWERSTPRPQAQHAC